MSVEMVLVVVMVSRGDGRCFQVRRAEPERLVVVAAKKRRVDELLSPLRSRSPLLISPFLILVRLLVLALDQNKEDVVDVDDDERQRGGGGA